MGGGAEEAPAASIKKAVRVGVPPAKIDGRLAVRLVVVPYLTP